MNIVDSIKEIHEKTKVSRAELFNKFVTLTLNEKIDLYCEAHANKSHIFLDDFLKKDGYYHTCEGVSLYDELYWERHETLSLSDVFDWVHDDFDEEAGGLAEFIKISDKPRIKVFRDLLLNNIGSATYDW